MVQPYVLWALLGMAGYSFMTLFVKLAERSGEASTSMVMAVASSIVAIAAIAIVAVRGELSRSCSNSSGRRCCGPSPEASRSRSR